MVFNVCQLLNIRKRIKIHNNEILNKKIRLDNEVWEVPSTEKLFVHYSIKSVEDIDIISIKQQQTSSEVQFIRPLDFRPFHLEKNSMFKCVSIVQLGEVEGEARVMKLPPVVVRWKRVGGNIENALVDVEDRLRPIDKTIGIELKEIDHLKQGEVGEIHYKLINYQSQELTLRIEAIENESALIVGTGRRELQLGGSAILIVSFKLLPLTIGEMILPELLIQIIREGKAISEVRISKRQTTLVL